MEFSFLYVTGAHMATFMLKPHLYTFFVLNLILSKLYKNSEDTNLHEIKNKTTF